MKQKIGFETFINWFNTNNVVLVSGGKGQTIVRNLEWIENIYKYAPSWGNKMIFYATISENKILDVAVVGKFSYPGGGHEWFFVAR